MPGKIGNMLREGQPSKIYFYAFAKPVTGYKLAQIITKQPRPFTARIYTTLSKMRREGLIFKTEQGFQSNPEPLIEEIEKDLDSQNILLTNNEKICVERILESEFFKEIVSSVADARARKPGDIDAAREISHILGVSSIRLYLTHRGIEKRIWKEMTSKEKAEFKGYVEQKVRDPKSENPIDQFLHYIDRPTLLKKLIKLLPVDLEKLWDTIEEAWKRIEKVKR